MIADVCHIETVVFVERDTMRLVQHGLGGQLSVAGEAFASVSGDRRNRVCLAIDSANNVVLHFDKEHISVAVEADLVGLIKFRFDGRSAVAGIAAPTAACDG